MITTLSGILVVNPGTLMRAAQHKSFAMLEITPQEITADLYDIS
jgi:predicted phosphodiesterase